MTNRLVDGEWVTNVDLTSDEGEFERQESVFRSRMDPDDVPEGRYHLYVSYACPWAHRTLVARSLLGLEDHISVDVVDPFRAADGWQFTPEREGCTTDSVHGSDYLREIYLEADSNYTGRVTVPVLWDRDEESIVNNESREIMREFALTASELDGDIDISPTHLRPEIDRLLDEIYEPINNGVYRVGFARTQAAYDRAVDALFEALDRWNDVLRSQRYLAGDRLTEADIAMFTTLVRFDSVYHTHFKCNRQLVREFDALWPYLRDLYTTPGFGDTTHLDHITEHYYTTHTSVNPTRIVPIGPDLDFEAPHDRDRLPGSRPA